MAIQKKEREFKYKLERIVVSNFRIGSPDFEIEEGELSLEFGYNFSFDFSKNLAKCLIHLKYVLHAENPEIQKVLVHGDINFDYEVLNLREFVKEDGEDYLLDNGVLGNLLPIAFCTSRGIIFERTRGYTVNNFLLPILPVNMLIEGNRFPKQS